MIRDRGTLVVSLAVLGGLAIGSYWFAERARLGDTESRRLGHEIDYTANRITLTRMDESGRAQYTIEADSLAHYADDDSGTFTQPRLVGSKPDRPQMRVRADRGTTTSEGEEVRLYGNVVFDRGAWRGNAPLSAKAAAMTVLPEVEKLSSDQPVDVVQGGSSVTAGGMRYDNAVRRIEMEGGARGGRVRHVIEPRAARPSSTGEARP